jgi:hypothetical protein
MNSGGVMILMEYDEGSISFPKCFLSPVTKNSAPLWTAEASTGTSLTASCPGNWRIFSGSGRGKIFS